MFTFYESPTFTIGHEEYQNWQTDDQTDGRKSHDQSRGGAGQLVERGRNSFAECGAHGIRPVEDIASGTSGVIVYYDFVHSAVSAKFS